MSTPADEEASASVVPAAQTGAQRPRRQRKAPAPVYVPDPNTRFSDDFSDGGSEAGSAADLASEGGELEAMEIVYEEAVEVESSCEAHSLSGDESADDEVPRTSAGYAKDGFVVSDDDAMSIDSDSESEFSDSDSDSDAESEGGSDPESESEEPAPGGDVDEE